MNIIEEAFKELNRKPKSSVLRESSEKTVCPKCGKEVCECGKNAVDEGVRAAGAQYDDLYEEVWDALSPIQIDKASQWDSYFTDAPYIEGEGSSEEILPAVEEDSLPAEGIKISPKRGKTLDRAIAVADAFGLTFEISKKDPNVGYIIFDTKPWDSAPLKIKELNLSETLQKKNGIDNDNPETQEEELEEALVNEFGYPYEDSLEEGYLREDLTGQDVPVTTLSQTDILNFISNVPKSEQGQPPRNFKLGYIVETTPNLAAKYRGGRGSIDKETGEAAPSVRVLKATEYSSIYVEQYASSEKTKEYKKAQGKDPQEDVLPRKGFKPSDLGIRGIFESLNGKGLAFGPLMQSSCVTKAKYFISINGSPFEEISRQDVAQYYPPSFSAEKAPRNEEGPQRTQTFYLTGIYMLGGLGHSIM